MVTVRGWLAVLLSTLAVGGAAAFGGGFDPGPGAAAGGGVTVGDAVSGGTANRVVVSDAAGDVATPDLLRVDLSNARLGINTTPTTALDVLGDNIFHHATGGSPSTIISRTAATDSSGLLFWTNFPNAVSGADPVYGLQHRPDETFWIKRNDGASDFAMLTFDTASKATFSGAVEMQSTLDIRGNISNGGSATCFTGVTGAPCFTENIVAIAPSSGPLSLLYTRNAGTDAQTGVAFVDSANVTTGGLRYYGTAHSLAVVQNKVGFFAQGGAASIIIGHVQTDVAAGTTLVDFRDGSNFANSVATIDGAGNLFLNASATRSKGTIALSGGTNTVTVASGSVCVCTDTTAINAVQCSVSSTTLTINGTGTDTIAYHCM